MGYYVMRSFGSKGVFDLIAIAPKCSDLQPPALMIQCKKRDYLEQVEAQALVACIPKYDAGIFVMTRDTKGHIITKDPREYVNKNRKCKHVETVQGTPRKNVDNKSKCRLQNEI